jgi:hypothetical protein
MSIAGELPPSIAGMPVPVIFTATPASTVTDSRYGPRPGSTSIRVPCSVTASTADCTVAKSAWSAGSEDTRKRGLESQTSPKPSPSPSVCDGFEIRQQLSTGQQMPSPS